MRAPQKLRSRSVLASRCLALALALAMPILVGTLLSAEARADSNCIDAAACSGSFDEANAGDNQGGDSGAEREPPADKKD
jgi:hypothetical protein